MSEFVANTALINKQLADRSHAFTSFDPETRARQEIDGFAAEVQAVYEEVSRYARSEAQKAFLAEEIQRFQSGYAAKYNAHLAAKGRCFSVMITGGSNFNNRTHDKANRSEDNRYQEAREYKERATAAMIRELKKMATEEAGGELVVLQGKIWTAESNQALMKASNAVLRKEISEEEKIKTIMQLMNMDEGAVRRLLKPDFAGQTGFPGFALQNNLANIRRMKERLAELQQKEATPTSDIAFAGGRIVDNAEADRVQILFDAIPDQATRDKLKGNGWRWSPREVAWQRKRTPQALYDAKRVTGVV